MAGGLPAGAAQVNVQGPQISKLQQVYAFTLVTALFFAWGFAYGLLDVLNKHFQDIFDISRTRSTALQVAYFGAYFVFSYPAAQFMSRFGYKKGIYLGLSLYSLGAIMFWPSAVTRQYVGFVMCTLVIGTGLASLEVAANSYIAVLGDPKHAAFRLNFSQAWNGVAAFTGPLIAARTFFHGENQYSLNTVQFVYLGVSGLGVLLIVLFWFCELPEISEAQLQTQLEDAGVVDVKPIWKQWHTIFGFIAQFAYVGAQVALASFVLNYVTEDPYLSQHYTTAEASNLFSYMQISFMLGRFVSTPLLRFFDPAVLLTIWALMTAVFTLVVALVGGRTGLGALYVVFFFESIQYPTIFVLGTENLGKWTKRGSSLIVMGVGGGAVFPPMQGAIADNVNTTISYLIPFAGYVIVVIYGIGTVLDRRRKTKLAAQLEAEGKADVPRRTGSDEAIKEKPEVEETESVAVQRA